MRSAYITGRVRLASGFLCLVYVIPLSVTGLHNGTGKTRLGVPIRVHRPVVELGKIGLHGGTGETRLGILMPYVFTGLL